MGEEGIEKLFLGLLVFGGAGLMWHQFFIGDRKRSLSGHCWTMRLVSRAFGGSLDLLFFRRRHEINCSGGGKASKGISLRFRGSPDETGSYIVSTAVRLSQTTEGGFRS